MAPVSPHMVAGVRFGPSRLRAWQSAIALGVFAAMLSLLDGTHLALQVPRASRPVIIMHILVGLFFYPIFGQMAVLFTRRFPLDVTHWLRNVVVHTGIGLTLQYFHYLLNHTLLVTVVWPVFFPGRVFPQEVIAGISPKHFREYPEDLLAYWIVIGFVYAARYYRELAEREVLAAKLEASLAEARLEVLRRQLSPHFLFNTLNAISVLAMRGDRDAVVETISQLSDLLRFATDESHPQRVPLVEELAFLDGYLGIQQVRFGDRLRIDLQIAPQSLDALVPFMVLQPIVENAIEHGMTEQCDGSRIRIETAVESDGMLRLEVSDDGPGFAVPMPELVGAAVAAGGGAAADSSLARPRSSGKRNGNGGGHSHGIGLSNTRRRLDQLYGSRHAVEYGHSASGGATVAIRIPFELSPAHG